MDSLRIRWKWAESYECLLCRRARAYEPGVHPSRTAGAPTRAEPIIAVLTYHILTPDDVNALKTALEALRAILYESGIGALPLDPSQLPTVTATSPTKGK